MVLAHIIMLTHDLLLAFYRDSICGIFYFPFFQMLYFEYKIYFSNSTPDTRIFPTSEMDFKELAERSSS